MKSAFPAIAAAAILPICCSSAQVADPIPDIQPSGFTVKLLNFVVVPSSGNPPQPARINHLRDPGDGSGRLFVNDQRGPLYVIEQGLVSLYLDLPANLPDFLPDTGFGTGFHSFTFHPEFAQNGRLYTVHMEPASAAVPDLVSPTTVQPLVHSVLIEWTADDPQDSVFSGTRREMLRIEMPTTAHSMQEIAFNPNATVPDEDYGLLYIGQGDGGRLNTTNPQGLDSPHGAILRIDPFGNNGVNGEYGIPATNPFANDGDPATLGEIWAFGLRNPHRISWDPAGDGKMLIGDIGQNNVEEVNIGTVGANYGWNEREGTFAFDIGTSFEVFDLPPDDALNGYAYPVLQYDHDDGNAIAGGYVYRGSLIPELNGEYLFADIVNGRIFHATADDLVQGVQTSPEELFVVNASGIPTTVLGLTGGARADIRFGVDSEGELYVLTKTDGRIRRVVSALVPDTDGDGEPDTSDNCTLLANADQRDTDGDGFGNRCDADLNNDGIVNPIDLGIFRTVFFTSDPDADFSGDGIVGSLDLGILRSLFFLPPGPGAP